MPRYRSWYSFLRPRVFSSIIYSAIKFYPELNPELYRKVPNEGGLEPQCRNAVEEFMEVVDPISDYKLNYALMDNCGDYIEDHCKMEQGLLPEKDSGYNSGFQI